MIILESGTDIRELCVAAEWRPRNRQIKSSTVVYKMSKRIRLMEKRLRGHLDLTFLVQPLSIVYSSLRAMTIIADHTFIQSNFNLLLLLLLSTNLVYFKVECVYSAEAGSRRRLLLIIWYLMQILHLNPY